MILSHRRRITNRLLYVEGNVAEEEYKQESFSCDAATFCGLLVQGEKMRAVGLPEKKNTSSGMMISSIVCA